MFLLAFLDLTVHNVQLHSYHFELLTNRNLALIYPVTICERKTKDCARSTYTAAPLFSTLMIAGFHSQTFREVLRIELALFDRVHRDSYEYTTYSIEYQGLTLLSF